MSSEFSGHRLSIACPHCNARARVRSSRQQTVTVRTANLQCTNVECGHTFAAQLAITHTISPSRIPSPDVVLPIAPPRAPANSANDNGGGAEVPLRPVAIAAAGSAPAASH